MGLITPDLGDESTSQQALSKSTLRNISWNRCVAFKIVGFSILYKGTCKIRNEKFMLYN